MADENPVGSEGYEQRSAGDTGQPDVDWNEEGLLRMNTDCDQYIRLLRLLALRESPWEDLLTMVAWFILGGLSLVLAIQIPLLEVFYLHPTVTWCVFLVGILVVLVLGTLVPKIICEIPRDRRVRPAVRRFVHQLEQEHPEILPGIRRIDPKTITWLECYLNEVVGEDLDQKE